jgi:hypothetical protein
MRISVPLALLAAVVLAGCDGGNGIGGLFADDARVSEDGPDTVRPQARADGAASGGPLSALSVNAAQAASLPPRAGETALGTETATLGDVADPGLWLLTRHVMAPVRGQVVAVVSGRATQVELRPSGGAGGRLSLAAMQALGLPITALAQVQVYALE